jgi:hypothetical protein
MFHYLKSIAFFLLGFYIAFPLSFAEENQNLLLQAKKLVVVKNVEFEENYYNVDVNGEIHNDSDLAFHRARLLLTVFSLYGIISTERTKIITNTIPPGQFITFHFSYEKPDLYQGTFKPELKILVAVDEETMRVDTSWRPPSTEALDLAARNKILTYLSQKEVLIPLAFSVSCLLLFIFLSIKRQSDEKKMIKLLRESDDPKSIIREVHKRLYENPKRVS